MKDVIIREATRKDFDLFYPFFKKCINGLFPQFTFITREFYLQEEFAENILEKALAQKKKFLYVALDDSTVIGILLVDKLYGGVGFAVWLAVDPLSQKHGIASSLLSLWEKNIVINGGHAAQLWTSKNNIHFYKKRGYILIGEFPQAWFGMDYYHFYKPLAAAEERNYLKEYLLKKKHAQARKKNL